VPQRTAPHEAEHLDVIIVGAGLSGIGAAYRLEETNPEATYAILEARDAIGGTWDLFRYPGVRSDSDMFTLSYPFRPWTRREAMAEGEHIRDYIRDTAAETGVGEQIRFDTRVVAASWSSAGARWTVTVQGATGESTLTCAFLYSCTGYYDYARGHQPRWPGVEEFRGTLVHPQSWPEDLDHTDRRVVVIGSGATAVTLVPALAERAAHVTMLQRSPSYLVEQPWRDPFADLARRLLPAGAAHRVARAKNVLTAIDGREDELEKFEYKPLGQLVELGSDFAVNEVMGVRFTGTLAAIFWRLAYLTRLSSPQSKAHQMTDWILGLFMRPAVTQVRGTSKE